MYKIIGADGREYGPVNIEQVRQWIAEGRANGQTRVQAGGTTDWKSLAEMPEFATLYIMPPLITPNHITRPNSQEADKKIAAGICGIILGGLGIHKFILGYTGEGVIMLLISICTCFIAYPIMHLFGIIEGIIYLTKPDEHFVVTYVTGKKGWF